MLKRLFFLYFIVLFGLADAQEAMKDVRLDNVRLVVKEIDASLSSCRRVEVQFEYESGDYNVSKRTIFVTPQGHICKLIEEGGTEHHVITSTYYYDEREVLRFAFFQCGVYYSDEAQGQSEHRVYFDRNGSKFKYIKRHISGLNETENDTFNEDWFIRNPTIYSQ